MAYLMGIDVGSSNCKVMLIDRSGHVLAEATHSYTTSYPRSGWAEQNPEDWYQCACHTIRDCLDIAGVPSTSVAGLSVDGPAHNVALMDDTGKVLYPTIHWSDLRSLPQSKRLAETHGERIFELTYCPVNPSWTLTQLLWLKENEPDVWTKLRKILVTKDYVRYRFTSVYQTDVYDAMGTQLYDVRRGEWSQELCDLLGFPVEWLPPVASVIDVAGKLTAVAAADTGLCEGIPVVVGSGDSVVEAFGIGATVPGACIVKLGTAANVNLVTARPYPSQRSITYHHVIDGTWFTITATNSGASTMRWFRDTFCHLEVQQAEIENISVYTLIDRLAEGSPPGADGLLFHPYLMGERSPYWNPQLRGDFTGISARHDMGHFARAVLEGVAFSIRDCLEVVESLGQEIKSYRLIGGGAKSKLWRQILCDVLGKPLVKPQVEDAAFGAAVIAGVAVGMFGSWQNAIDTCVRVEETLIPNAVHHTLYNQYFAVYQDMVGELAKHTTKLSQLADRQT